MTDVAIKSFSGSLLTLTLATDDKGNPLFKTRVQDFIQPGVQTGEYGYSSFLPRLGGVFAMTDFSGGVGSRIQKLSTSDNANKYWFADRADCSTGRIQKGPKVTTLTAPANSGTLTGAFELGGTCYLILGRKIVSWGGAGSDALTEVRDYGLGFVGSGTSTFLKLGSEAALESNTGVSGATADIQSADTRIAQQLRTNTTNVLFLSKVDVQLIRTGTVTGDVRLRVFTDKNGRPGSVIGTSRQLAANVGTALTVVSFRFDDDEIVPIPYNEPLWLVMDVASASATTYIQWARGTVSGYSRGDAYLSTDGENSYSAYGTTDVYFNVFAKTPSATAYVGATSASKFFATTTDGSSYTDDTYRTASHFCIVNDVLVRDVLTASSNGVIEYSLDGTNWSAAIPIGDVTVPITNMLNLNGVLIVCKEDSIWAVDFSDLTAITSDSLEVVGSRSTSNGLGATVWKSTAYVPFGHRLVAITGSFDNGFTVTKDVSPSILDEWGDPHGSGPLGAGHVMAVAGDRFHLYAILAGGATTDLSTGLIMRGHVLYKCADPLRTVNDRVAPQWHGSLAFIGTSANQTVQSAYVFDPGGTASPELFCTVDTSGNIGRIRLPRTADPSADTSYVYDTVGVGQVTLPDVSLGFPIHPKAWINTAITFYGTPPATDYVDVAYKLPDDHETTKRLGRFYETSTVSFDTGIAGRLLRPTVIINNHASTSSPIIDAMGISGAVRPSDPEAPREISFSVLSDDTGITGSPRVANGIINDTKLRALHRATRGGTRTLIGPDGEEYRSVLFLDAAPALTASGQHVIDISAVQVG